MQYFASYNLEELQNLIKYSGDLKVHLDEKISSLRIYISDIYKFVNQKIVSSNYKNFSEKKKLEILKDMLYVNDTCIGKNDLNEIIEKRSNVFEKQRSIIHLASQSSLIDYEQLTKGLKNDSPNIVNHHMIPQESNEIMHRSMIHLKGDLKKLVKNKTEKVLNNTYTSSKLDNGRNAVNKLFANYKIPAEKVLPL